MKKNILGISILVAVSVLMSGCGVINQPEYKNRKEYKNTKVNRTKEAILTIDTGSHTSVINTMTIDRNSNSNYELKIPGSL